MMGMLPGSGYDIVNGNLGSSPFALGRGVGSGAVLALNPSKLNFVGPDVSVLIASPLKPYAVSSR
jgi:hypothetical protein